MPKFSQKSKERLKTVNPLLQVLFERVVKEYDCKILEGYRDADRQERLYQQEKTKVKYPHSKHNRYPSLAVDVSPYPIDWGDAYRFYHFAGYVQAWAEILGIPLRWGGDWDRDKRFKEEKFRDLCHFELREV